MTKKRTDLHREGAIIPADYVYVFSYNLSSTLDGWPVPSFNVNCEMDTRWRDADGVLHQGTHSEDRPCCILGLKRQGARFASHGTTGKCTICGAAFVYGDIWKHVPTGEHIHVGHICAEKMCLLVDRSEYELERDRIRKNVMRELARERNAAGREAFLGHNPGLAEALETDHYIVQDIKRKFIRELSPPQVELVMKLAREVKERARIQAERDAETKVPAPIETGRQTVEGVVVGLRQQETMYGLSYKMTVKVSTEQGVWLAWGTQPASLDGAEVGVRVRFDAKLQAGREEHFAIFSRPTKAVIVEPAMA